jgi:hypothetical protein
MKVFTFGVMSGLSRCGQRLRPCGLSKSEYYLADNLHTVILSQMKG